MDKKNPFMALFEKSREGIVLISYQGVILFANPAAGELFGQSKETLVGSQLGFPLVNGEKARIEILNKKRGPRKVELMMTTTEWYDRPAMLAILRDVTAEDEMQEELTEKQRTLQSVINGLPGQIFQFRVDTDNNYSFTYLSKPDETLTGYPSEKILNNIDTVFGQLSTNVKAELLRRVHESIEHNTVFSFVFPIKRTDATEKWLNTRAVPYVQDDGSTVFYGIALDITERMEAQEKQRLSEEKFSQIFHISPDPILISDLESGTVQDVNDSFLSVLGLSREECIGKTTYEIGLWEEKGNREEFVQSVLQQGASINQERMIKVRGRQRYFLISSTILTLQGQHRFLTFMRDITEIRRTHQDMVKAKEEAEKANRAKSDFLANVSHEIRTPMNAIIGSSYLLLDSGLSEHQKEYAETIMGSGSHLLSLIDEILDFSKIEAGKLKLSSAPFNFNELVEQVIDLVTQKSTNKSIEIVFDIDPHIPSYVVGDSVRLRQVLVNIVGNAVKFTSEGEVVVRGILESERDEEVGLRFEVHDTGIGFPQHKLAQVFAPFSQADATTSRKYGGTGLGLSITKRLVEMMNGKIWIANKPEKGAVVTVECTLKKEADRHITKDGTSQKLQDIGLQDIGPQDIGPVLIAVGNPAARTMLTRLFDFWGIPQKYVTAAEVLTAMEQDPEPSFGLVLIDAEMEGIEYSTIAATLREKPEFRNSYIVVMSSKTSKNPLYQEYKRYGFDGCILKPIKPLRLLSFLAHLSGRSTETASEQPQQDNIFDFKESRKKVRILMVEDNPVNRKIGVISLQKLGYSVDTAENGKEALNAVKNTGYDLIFMDIQMPYMDGYEATSSIRRGDDLISDPQLPIIAMTAHALQGDREKSIEAGMNDYITKPINPDKLINVIRHWLPEDDPPVQEVRGDIPQDEAGDSTSETGGGVFNWDKLLESTHNDYEHVAMLIETFLNDMPEHLLRLDECAAKEDQVCIEQLAHTIKGAALTMHTRPLHEAAQKVENAAKEAKEKKEVKEAGTSTELKMRIETLKKEIQNTVEAMRGRLA